MSAGDIAGDAPLQRRQQRRLAAAQRPQQHHAQHALLGRRSRNVHAAKALHLAPLVPEARHPEPARRPGKGRQKAKAAREELHPHNRIRRRVAQRLAGGSEAQQRLLVQQRQHALHQRARQRRQRLPRALPQRNRPLAKRHVNQMRAHAHHVAKTLQLRAGRRDESDARGQLAQAVHQTTARSAVAGNQQARLLQSRLAAQQRNFGQHRLRHLTRQTGPWEVQKSHADLESLEAWCVLETGTLWSGRRWRAGGGGQRLVVLEKGRCSLTTCSRARS